MTGLRRSRPWAGLVCSILAAVLQSSPCAEPGGRAPLVFLADREYPPMTYLEDGLAKGMDVDVARALALAMQREIRVDLMDWNLAQEKVLRGEADALLGMTISDERRKSYDFSATTFSREFGLLVRKGEVTVHTVGDLKGKRVGVTSGGFPRQFMEAQPGVKLVLVSNYEDGFGRLTGRTIDAMAVDLWVAAYLLEKNGTRGVAIVGKPFATSPAAIGVKRGNTALIKEVNRALKTLQAEGKITEIRENWQPQEMLFLSRERVRSAITLAVAGALLVLLGVMGAWIFTLKRQMRIRLQAESAAREASERLRESEERYRSFITLAAEGIARMDFDPPIATTLPAAELAAAIVERGFVAECNDAAARMRGWSGAGEMLGRRVVELMKTAEPENRLNLTRFVEGGFKTSDAVTMGRDTRGGDVFFLNNAVGVVHNGCLRHLWTVQRDITGQRLAETALRESEARFRSYFELGLVGMAITSRDRGFVTVNDQLCTLLGFSRAELMHKRWPDLIHGEDLPADLARFARVLAGELPGYSMDKRFICKDGRIIHATVSIRCVRRPDGSPDYFIGLVQDITERKRAEVALSENQRRLTTLLGNLPGLTYRCRNDKNWTMEFVSEGCRDLTGYSPEELLENNRVSYAELIHPDDQQPVWQAVQAALAARVPYELTCRLRAAGGAEKWVWERGQGVFSADGAVIALEGFITDVTTKHQAEVEREQALLREQRAQEEYTRQLIASQEAERRRIAGELHDSLGQNLLLLKNRAQLALGSAGLGADLREQIEGMKEAATHAIAEVRQISQDLHPYQIEHLGLTRALAAMLDSVSGSTSIAFKCKFDEVDEVFTGDMAANLYRVVQEALNNILKHSGASRVEVMLERDVREVRLWVADDGRGFGAWNSGAHAASKGLGLKNIAERVRIMGGALTVNSEPGAGTRIEVIVPIAGL